MSSRTRRVGSVPAKIGYSFKRFFWQIADRDGLITVTHCGKLGDFIASLPVASWLYKTRGKRIHFVLASSFEPFTKIESLLLLQEMTGEVTLADFPIADWEKGGRPYEHNPNRFGVRVGEYYNFGFRHAPRRFVPEYVAEEWGLGVDSEFKLNLGEYAKHDGVLCSDDYMLVEVPQATALDLTQDLLTNARLMAGARESHVSQSGLFHILDWAGVTPTRVYIYPHSVNLHLFTQRLNEFDVKQVHRAVR
ncbi:hypothetical protein IT157_03890 [bacterium]|nr:hypothetical protein [bacterium]